MIATKHTTDRFYDDFLSILRERVRYSHSDLNDSAAMTFARYLRAVRSCIGFTQQQVAEKAGLPLAEIVALEHGLIISTAIKLTSLKALARVLGRDIRDFGLILERELPTPGPTGFAMQLRSDLNAITAYFGSIRKSSLILVAMIATVIVWVLSAYGAIVRSLQSSQLWFISTPPLLENIELRLIVVLLLLLVWYARQNGHLALVISWRVAFGLSWFRRITRSLSTQQRTTHKLRLWARCVFTQLTICCVLLAAPGPFNGYLLTQDISRAAWHPQLEGTSLHLYMPIAATPTYTATYMGAPTVTRTAISAQTATPLLSPTPLPDSAYSALYIPIASTPTYTATYMGAPTVTRTVISAQTATSLLSPTPLPDSAYSTLHNTAPSTGWTAFADPGINIGFGSFVWQELDLTVPGRGLSFVFLRTYNSANTTDGPLGRGWTHSYNLSFTRELATSILIRMPDGRLDRYALSNGMWTPPPGIFNTLTDNGDGTFTLKLKDQTRYNFDFSGRLTTMVDRNNNTLTLTYTGGNLTAIADPSGRNFTFAYDTNNHLISVTDPSLRQVGFGYSANGDLTSVTDPLGEVAIYYYDVNHRLVSLIDANGNAQFTLAYDSQSRVKQSRDAQNNTTTFSFNNGETVVCDPRGNTTTYSFDDGFRVTGVQDPLGNSVTLTYNSSNQLTSFTDKRGSTAQYLYDVRGNVAQIKDALNGIVSATYDDMNNQLTVTDQLNRTTQFKYDANGNLLRITDPLSNITNFSYDEFGQVKELTDAMNRVTLFIYDSLGNLRQVKDALQNITSFNYDLLGRITGVTDANGHTTMFAYDRRNLLTIVTNGRGEVTTYTYDANGNLISTTDPLGNTFSYTYDALNRLIRESDPLGNTFSYTYDENSNLTARVDAEGHMTSFAYDALNRLISTTDALGLSATYEYDATGNQIAMVDANGVRTTHGYDALNRLVTVNDALTNVVRYEYDPVGNLIGVVNPKGARTTYTYDALNRLIHESDPLGNTFSYTYDENSNLTVQVDAEGHTTSWTYDPLNRISQINYPATAGVPASTIAFGYDEVGNRISMTDTTGVTNYAYDELNRLISLTNSANQTVSYLYDDAGRRARITYPNGAQVNYLYDNANRLIAVQDPTGTTRFAYDALGNRTGITYPNGVTGSYSYDLGNRLTAITYSDPIGNILFFANYVLDKVGNHLQMMDSEGLTTYEYDPLYRLTKVTYPDNSWQQFEHDANGNLLKMTDLAGFTTYSYDSADRLLNMSRGMTTTNFTWNKNGNMTAKDNFQYIYDAANRLTRVTDGSNTIEYAYNGDGHRMQKKINNVVTTYLWDTLSSSPVILYETTGTSITRYEHAWQLPAQISPDGVQSLFHADALGNTLAPSSVSSDMVGAYNNKAYGSARLQASGQITHFQFTEQQVDAETGFIFLGDRYYDPSLRTFLSRDAFRRSSSRGISENRYAYAWDNLANATNSDDRDTCSYRVFHREFGSSCTSWYRYGQWPNRHDTVINNFVANTVRFASTGVGFLKNDIRAAAGKMSTNTLAISQITEVPGTILETATFGGKRVLGLSKGVRAALETAEKVSIVGKEMALYATYTQEHGESIVKVVVGIAADSLAELGTGQSKGLESTWPNGVDRWIAASLVISQTLLVTLLFCVMVLVFIRQGQVELLYRKGSTHWPNST
jgi:RHS repeat-associated protein